MQQNKNTTILAVIAIVVLLVAILGATYAYFQAQLGDNAYQNVTIRTYTSDSAMFNQGDDINLNISQSDLSEDKIGTPVSATSTGVVSFIAGTSSASEFCYSVTMNINSNNFVCSEGNTNSGTYGCEQPELQLTVTKNGTTIIDGLDITRRTTNINYSTLINGNNYYHKISVQAGDEQLDTFVTTVRMNNLNINQQDNTEKTLSAQIIYNKETCPNYPTLVDTVKAEYTSNTAAIADGYGVYYHNGTITGASAGIDSTTDILDAEDLSYRYAGASDDVNNYVCFGTNITPCPDENKYRIIGLFTEDNGSTYQAKLIKNIEYTTTAWDDSNSNTWMRPATIRTTLNGAYLTTLGNWASLIYQPTWKVGGGGYTSVRLIPAKTGYTNEMAATGESTKPTTGKTDASGAYIDNESKIGLIYVSDYGYAATPGYWKTKMSGSSEVDYRTAAKNYDWLFTGYTYWTISRSGDNTYCVYIVYDIGVPVERDANNSYAVRPSFYLNSNVKISSGTGKSNDPWIIIND